MFYVNFDELIKNSTPVSLMNFYDNKERNASFKKAYKNFCGCNPILIKDSNCQVGEYRNGVRELVYDHFNDRFVIFEIGRDWYEITTKCLNAYVISSFDFENRKFYLDVPNYLNWIAGSGNRYIQVFNESVSLADPVMIRVEISYDKKISWPGIGFSIEDGFHQAYANMRKQILTNRG